MSRTYYLETEVPTSTCPERPRTSPASRRARDYLDEVRRRGCTQLLEKPLSALAPGVADKLRRDLLAVPVPHFEPFGPEETPDWFRSARAEAPVIKKAGVKID